MKIEINIPDGSSGNWSISTFTVEPEDLSQKISLWKTGRGVPAGTYKRLMRGDTVVMSNTPDEIRDFTGFLWRAKGSILINGLGLGVTLKALLEKPEVTDITVIEKSQDVINLVASSYTDPRVTIINGDAFIWEPPNGKIYDCVWHDIWDNICADNLPEMKKLHRKYGKRSNYQESWCRYQCERQQRESKRFYWVMLIPFLLISCSPALKTTDQINNMLEDIHKQKVLLCVYKTKSGTAIFETPIGNKQYLCTSPIESKRWSKGDTLIIRYKGKLLSDEDEKTILSLKPHRKKK